MLRAVSLVTILALIAVSAIFAVLKTDPPTALVEIPKLQHRISLMSPEQLAPYSWDSSPDASITIEWAAEAYRAGDPLQVFTRAFRILRSAASSNDTVKLAAVRDVLDDMLNDYQPRVVSGDAHLWRYGYQYEKLAPGWWSGMDGLLGPLVYWALGEATGETRYQDIAVASAKAALQSPGDGGVLWRDRSGCWISEYTWEGMSRSDEYHVLNGHLYGLEALYLLAAASQDDELIEAYSCARKGTEARADSFFREDMEWNYYQTDPKVISPAHYLLFEAAQFQSLYGLTGDQLYLDQSQVRKSIFARHFPVHLWENDGEVVAAIAAVGAPHTYWPDNYGFRLTCTSGSDIREMINTDVYSPDLPLAVRLVNTLPLEMAPDSCEYRVRRGDFEMLVYQQSEFAFASSAYQAFSAVFTGSYGAEGQSGETVKLAPGSESRIDVPIETQLSATDILAFALKPSENLQLSVILNSKSGKSVQRYYPDLQSGCNNLVALNLMGFDNSEGFGDTLTSFSVRLYTHTLTGSASAEISNLAMLKNPLQLQNYLTDQGADFCISLQ